MALLALLDALIRIFTESLDVCVMMEIAAGMTHLTHARFFFSIYVHDDESRLSLNTLCMRCENHLHQPAVNPGRRGARAAEMSDLLHARIVVA